jgi:hypothetical protein
MPMSLILPLAQTLTFQTKQAEAASPFYWIPFIVLAVAILIALVAVIRDNRGKLWGREDPDG